MNCTRVSEYLVGRLKDYISKTSLSGFSVGVSGGIDSALVSKLCALTGLPTTCVTMPIHQAPDHIIRGDEHIVWLKKSHPNVTSVNVDLTETFDRLTFSLPEVIRNNPLLMANVRARLRMTALYSFGNLVAGTGNKVEDFGVGFFTKYGDGGVDISPIGDLLKSEVYELSRFYGVIDSILGAKPTDGLWADNRSDEDQIGASYPELEWAMDFCEDYNHDKDRIDKALQMVSNGFTVRQKEVIGIYLRFHSMSAHKMKMPEIFHIPADVR